ncbi:hypothetical protein CLOP_g3906 [Closterium sp. NIES-67]|nr:hypothetical protein CLOP_g3906 [Closterium sp. NIES-67]
MVSALVSSHPCRPAICSASCHPVDTCDAVSQTRPSSPASWSAAPLGSSRLVLRKSNLPFGKGAGERSIPARSLSQRARSSLSSPGQPRRQPFASSSSGSGGSMSEPLSSPLIAAASSSGGVAGPSSADTTAALTGRNGGNGGARALQIAAVAAAAVVAAAVGATAWAGGPSSIISVFAKSGFTAAFSLIFVSEIGDKTFFIAALLAMRHSKLLVLCGAVSALGIMSAISAGIGRLFREVPAQLQTSIPVGEYLACALLVWFGIKSIQSALKMPATPIGAAAPAAAAAAAGGTAGAGAAEGDEEEGELAEAREFVEKAEAEKPVATTLEVFWEAFSLIFLAEWGDRSMLATIALGAAQNPVGVALGATVGHLLATGLAVIGGALLSKHISERFVGIAGGVLFFIFAAATIFGVF